MNNYHFYKSENIEFVTINDTYINFSEHCHTSDFVITLIMKGNAILKKGMTQICICPNEIFTVVPYERHTLNSNGNVELISMCIKKQTVYHLDEKNYQECIVKALLEISKVIELNAKKSDEFYETAFNIYKRYHKSFLAESNHFEISRSKLENYPECTDTVEQLANEIFVSKYHYIRKFKKVSGLTPHKFQIQSRIRKAQYLLNNGISIADVAVAVGFYDQSHFDKYFKKIVGIAPVEYVYSVSNILQAKK